MKMMTGPPLPAAIAEMRAGGKHARGHQPSKRDKRRHRRQQRRGYPRLGIQQTGERQ